MGKVHELIDEPMAEFLTAQPVFFVATAPLDPRGIVNCSPKGNRGEFAILNATTVAYIDQTGSGIETVAHLRENGRIALMFCAFTGPAKIVRLQGTGSVVTPSDADFEELLSHFSCEKGCGIRSIITVAVERLSDSCGYGVPFMDFRGHRPVMDKWIEKKGPDGIEQYWTDHNQKSIDGLLGLEITPSAAAQQ